MIKSYLFLFLFLVVSLLLMPAIQPTYAKCEKFDHDLCKYVISKRLTENKKLRVLIYAPINITKELEKVAKVEHVEKYGEKYIFQVSIFDTNLTKLKDIPSIEYVSLIIKPIAEEERDNSISVITLVLAIIITLLVVGIVWGIK